MTPAESGLPQVPGGVDWRRPRVETPGLQRYVQVLRERIWVVVATVIVTTLAAAVYLATADKVYKADADLLITPVSSDDPTLTGLPLLRESSDPTRDVETAAKLVTTRDVAARVSAQLHSTEKPSDLLKKVKSEPVAQSNIVSVTASGSTPAAARNLANAFADGVVAERSAELRRAIDQRVPSLRERASRGEPAGTTDSPADELSRLTSLRQSGDPTVGVETRAETPSSPSEPRPRLTLAAGVLAGLILGVVGAFAMHVLDPRLRREEQLRELYSLPVLARIPRERRAPTKTTGRRRLLIGPRRSRRRALSPGQLSPLTLEAFRTLRTMLAAARRGRGSEGRSVLVTGPSPSEGKTTTAINLAASFALAGHRVILIEADFRRPTVGEALGVRPQVGIGKVLLGNVPVEEALVPVRPFGDNLRTLLVDRADDWLAEVLSLPAASALLDEAERLADYVVIDSPPLTEVIDALPLAQQVDDVVLVVRLGSSNISQLTRLGDLLEQHRITPSGFVVVGVGSSEESSYYISARRERAAQDWVPPADEEPERVASAERG
ncbi:MAG TPA: Wzz/FepE/Etk N-terminal domain-containing protein [Thermoleophilaceae bacterium]|jgi:capsular exopolysaccharide synthesis family protein